MKCHRETTTTLVLLCFTVSLCFLPPSISALNNPLCYTLMLFSFIPTSPFQHNRRSTAAPLTALPWIDGNKVLHSCHGDERTPEPKPRWNPKPEQIRVLEAIFNSGMMNPPRDDIKKIREQLQEYGPIGEANVFYWFQNRKSRSKNKHRNFAKRKNKNSVPPNNNSIISAQTITNDNVSGNQNLATDYFHTPIETNFQLSTPPLFSFPNQFSNMTQQLPQQNVDVPNLLNHEILIPMNEQYDQGNIQDHEATMNIMQQLQEDPQLISLGVTSNSLNDDSTLPPLPPIVDAPFTDPFSITQLQGNQYQFFFN
ncbi:unnamed protein product [Trifolium pratense]|uniref:Uncharacterized protein n=1 Tax=Trifolium pratense TaxID=57577 RepID=A0ACB0MBN6_TRIPR|nr:unnamed protein product [Trifolium pratense]